MKQRVSDFKPLQLIELPGLGELDCSGLILLVGPNSSGKTQLLRDVHDRLMGSMRNFVVARRVELQKPVELNPYLSCLQEEGYIRMEGQTIIPTTTRAGTGERKP